MYAGRLHCCLRLWVSWRLATMNGAGTVAVWAVGSERWRRDWGAGIPGLWGWGAGTLDMCRVCCVLRACGVAVRRSAQCVAPVRRAPCIACRAPCVWGGSHWNRSAFGDWRLATHASRESQKPEARRRGPVRPQTPSNGIANPESSNPGAWQLLATGAIMAGDPSSISWGARWTPPRSQVPSNVTKRAHPTRLGRPLGP
jgi:hypothetical protein